MHDLQKLYSVANRRKMSTLAFLAQRNIPRSCLGNYRPICLMSNIGKLLEAVILNQLTCHLESIFPNNMFGFRPGRSTQDAVVHTLDNIHQLRESGYLVAVVAFNATSSFDCLDHSVILRSLEAIGVGSKMRTWISSFLKDCLIQVDIDGHLSSPWTVNIGVGQGRKLSPPLYNVGTLTQLLFNLLSQMSSYADDSCDVIHARSSEDCNKRILEVVSDRIQWFKDVGLTMNIPKTELMGIGFTPSDVTIGDTVIHPKNEIKFLGTIIQANLKWESQVSFLRNKLRSAAARIRTEGRHFTVSDKRILFHGWVVGQLHCNGLAFLPALNMTEIDQLQRAMNAGIRAVVGLPRYGYAPISDITAKLGLPTLQKIKEKVLLQAAWKRFHEHKPKYSDGPMTRGRSMANIPHGNQKGHAGKISSTVLIPFWNRLPLTIKEQSDPRKAKRDIKKFLSN